MLGRDLVDGFEIRQLPEQVDRNNRPGFGRDFPGEFAGIDIERRRFDLRENDFPPHPGDRPGRGEEREARADDLISRLDAQRHQRAKQRIAPAADADGVLDAAILSQIFLEFLDMRPQDQRLLIEHFVQRPADFLADRAVLRLQIQQLHVHAEKIKADGAILPYRPSDAPGFYSPRLRLGTSAATKKIAVISSIIHAIPGNVGVIN